MELARKAEMDVGEIDLRKKKNIKREEKQARKAAEGKAQG